MNTFVAKFGSVIFGLSVIILIVEGDFFSRSPLVILGQVVGLSLMIFGRVSFGKGQFKMSANPGEGGLIERGPFRFIRHPIYAGATLLVWVSILGRLTLFNVAIGVVLLAVILWRISIEEVMLRQQFPEYAEYTKRTKKIIPFIF